MRVLLDTNFVLTCMKQKIDFVSLADEVFDEVVLWVVAEEVVQELDVLSEKKGEKVKDREAAKLGLLYVKDFKKVTLKNKNVDDGIVNYVKKNKVVVATLDRGLKERVRGRVLTIRGKKGLVLV